ncbi:hypothetical protein QBC37DRAFT_380399 [Rhypophila decipiens]|uniref:Uncharacterized protein n=1 Tax=Rhypophila decipiens TaxID=261697 RepID=A0AAN7B1T5_9PEZI|nr:hypothetical protein QBC37DRAFT_380399 [Rhypophila decipiens]
MSSPQEAQTKGERPQATAPHVPGTQAVTFQAFSTMAVDPNASGLARWLAQEPHEDNWTTFMMNSQGGSKHSTTTPNSKKAQAGCKRKFQEIPK